MEAFFPLIASALIYFVVCRSLARLFSMVLMRRRAEQGLRKIEGVEL